MYKLINGDCLDVLQTIESESIDSIITDPPYALTNRVADVPACNKCGRQCGGSDKVKVGDNCPRCGNTLVSRRTMTGSGFMGKDWDNGIIAFSPEIWKEALRVAKPGAHLLAFGGDRTHHRLMCAIEDAGWEIRTCIYYAFGSGFPKGTNVSKNIDKMYGAKREVIGSKVGQPGYSLKPNDTESHNRGAYGKFNNANSECEITAPATEDAKNWEGWGSALKPAVEIIVMARKPLIGTIAQNVLKYGTGAINIDGSRVDGKPRTTHKDGNYTGTKRENAIFYLNNIRATEPSGRWPSNLIIEDTDEVKSLFPNNVRMASNPEGIIKTSDFRFMTDTTQGQTNVPETKGSASKFFKSCLDEDPEDKQTRRLIYLPKASKRDKNEGCESLPYLLNSDCPPEIVKEIETLLTLM